MEWLNGLEGITEEHKSWVSEQGIDSPSKLFELAQRPAPNWSDGLGDEHKGYLEVKGFKDLPSILDSYKNLESTVGVPADKLVKLPTKSFEEDPKAWEGVFGKLGRPESADGYEISVPEGMQGSEDAVNWAKETFHKLGLTKRQGEDFIKAWNDWAVSSQAENDTKRKYDDIAAEKELRMKWGAAYDKNVSGAFSAAKQLGFKQEEIATLEQTFGKVRTYEMLQSVFEKVGEDSFVSGDGASGPLSPAGAKAKIEEKKADKEWMEQWMAGNPKHKQEMDNWVVMAHADEFQRSA